MSTDQTPPASEQQPATGTPRTDAAKFRARWAMGLMRQGEGEVVDADVCAKLEREISVLQKENEELKERLAFSNSNNGKSNP